MVQMHGPGFMVARGFRMDPNVTKQKLKPGTVRRIASYARPYRLKLSLFLVATALDAVITVVNPLLLRELIDNGIIAKDEAVVLVVALTVAGVALFDALLGVVNRWFSSRIGEGLIYDLRTQVFDHVQRQPIAFFTRAQTGSLVSRLDGDVVGAQSGDRRDAVQRRGQRAVADRHPDHHVLPVLAGQPHHAGADPAVHASPCG